MVLGVLSDEERGKTAVFAGPGGLLPLKCSLFIYFPNTSSPCT